VRKVTATRIIPATPTRIFDLLADPRRHSEFDGSGTVRAPRKAPHRLSLGASFAMDMKAGFSYFVTNRVVVFELDRAIAWSHFGGYVWRYDLLEVDGGTRVTESFDYSVPAGLLIARTARPENNRLAMEASLRRIEELLTTTESS